MAAAANDAGMQTGLVDGRHHVLEERFAGRAGLLGAVEHRNRGDGCRQRRNEAVRRERPVQTHLEHAYTVTARVQRLDGFLDCFTTGPHHDHDVLGVRGSGVIEQVVLTAD